MSSPINYSPPSGVHDHHPLSTAASQSLPAWAFRVETNSDARHLAKRSELSPPLNTPWGPQRTSKEGMIWPDRIAQGSLTMTLDTPSGPHHTNKDGLIWPDRIAQGSLKMTLNTPWGPHHTSKLGLIWPEGLARNLAEQSGESPNKRWRDVLAEQISRPPYTQSESQAEQTGEPRKRWSEILAEQTSRPPYTQGESMLKLTGKPRKPLWKELAPRSNHRAVGTPLIRRLGNEPPLRVPNTSRTAPTQAMTLDKTATPTLAKALARINSAQNQKGQVLDCFLDALLRITNDVARQSPDFGPARRNVALQALLKDQVEGLSIVQTQRVLTYLRNGLGASARAIAQDARQRLAQGTGTASEQQRLSSLAQADHLAASLLKALNRKLGVPIAESRPSNALTEKPARLSAAEKQALARLAAGQAAPAG